MTVTLELKIVVGSTRQGRAADLGLPWLVGRAETHGAFAVDVLDLRNWPLPMFRETYAAVMDPELGRYSDPVVQHWNRAIAAGDSYLFLTPEYNHSVPAVLKNAIDSVFGSFGFRNKVAGFVGYSAGLVGGARAVEHLAHIAIEAELVPLRNAVLIAQVHQAYGEDGDRGIPGPRPASRCCSTTSPGGETPCGAPGTPASCPHPTPGGRRRPPDSATRLGCARRRTPGGWCHYGNR